MIFSTCSRLARQSAIPRLPTTSLLASPCPRSSPSLLGQSTNLSRCAFSSSRPRARSRFAPAEAEDQSPFKRHRLEEFAKDEASEDRVLKSLYPRLESDPLRRSVGDFLEAFDQDIENSHARKVALTGRVRRIHPVGKHLLFLDIVNEFRKVQVMVNAKNLERNSSGMRMPAQRFKMFRHLIKVGDHICKSRRP
jgi:lysyl-tRNA synthetase class 2